MKYAFIFIILLSFGAKADEPSLLNTLKNMKDDREVALKRNSAEGQLMVSEALKLGSDGGRFYRGQQINDYLESHAEVLDATRDVERLGLVKKYKGVYISFPVVTEQDYAVSMASDKRSFVIRDKVYRIVKNPKMRPQPPNWREFLLLDNKAPSGFPAELLPRNKAEKKLWEEYVERGWKLGVEYANQQVLKNITRLTREIMGMQLYVLLKQRKMITHIQITDQYYPVSGGGYQLNIEESRVSIGLNPQLSSNRWNWQPIPQLADITGLFPKGTSLPGYYTDNYDQ